jgi:hypothetical protein
MVDDGVVGQSEDGLGLAPCQEGMMYDSGLPVTLAPLLLSLGACLLVGITCGPKELVAIIKDLMGRG